MKPSKKDLEYAKNLFKEVFSYSPTTIKPYLSGLGNVVLLIDEKYVMRIKKENDPLFYSMENEKNIFEVLSNESLAPNLILFKDDASAIYDNFDGKTFLTPFITENSMKEIGSFLKKMHSLKIKDITDFNASKRFDYYKNNGESKTFEPLEKEIRIAVESYINSEEKVICHNDIVEGNLLKRNDKIVIIDFEYAAKNHPLFDLASILSENKINNASQKKALLEGYGYKVDAATMNKLNQFILYEDYLWMYWAKNRYKETGDEAFLDIEKEKREQALLNSRLLK